MPGLRGSFEHTLVSHRNPGDGNTAETGSQALGAPFNLGGGDLLPSTQAVCYMHIDCIF